MAKATKYGSTKRFGVRYGRTVKEKFGALEKQQKASYKCPKCHKPKVKRVNTGIWQCTKCNYKFAGKAYYVPKAGSKKVTEEDIQEEQPEEDDEDIQEETKDTGEESSEEAKKEQLENEEEEKEDSSEEVNEEQPEEAQR